MSEYFLSFYLILFSLLPLFGQSEDSLFSKKGIIYRKVDGDLFTGTIIERYESGEKKSLVEFYKGKRHGISVWWYENGQRSLEMHFENGIQKGHLNQWYSNGQKLGQAFIIGESFEFEGESITWYRSGKVNTFYNYKNGKLNGLQVVLYENGQIKTISHYINGELEGEKIKYKANGKIKSRKFYLHGRRIFRQNC